MGWILKRHTNPLTRKPKNNLTKSLITWNLTTNVVIGRGTVPNVVNGLFTTITRKDRGNGIPLKNW